jgi:hypothetical protein
LCRAGLEVIAVAGLEEIGPLLGMLKETWRDEPNVFIDYSEAADAPVAFMTRLRDLVGPTPSFVVVTDELGISQLPIAVQCVCASSVTRAAEPETIHTAMSLARAASNTFSANEEQVENLIAARRSLSVLVAER